MNTVLLIAAAVLVILSIVLRNWLLGACSLACLILSFFLNGSGRLFAVALAASVGLTGCVTGPDGSTRLDTEAISTGIGAVERGYGLYRQYNNPLYSPEAYRHSGEMYYAPTLVP